MAPDNNIDWMGWNSAEFQRFLDDNSQALQIPPEIYRRILTKAVDQTRQDIPRVDAAFTAGDIDTIQTVSHRWKGDYDNLRITPLAQTARRINNEAKGGQDKGAMTTDYEQFKTLFNQMTQRLET